LQLLRAMIAVDSPTQAQDHVSKLERP
jgi:hypothetical protein